MIKLIKRGDQNQTTAMKTLLALLRLFPTLDTRLELCSRPEGLQALDAERGEVMAILFENLYSTVPAVVALSLVFLDTPQRTQANIRG